MIESRKGIKNGKFFPGELINSIKTILQGEFKEKLKGSKLKVDGCNFGVELVLRVDFENSDGKLTTIEASIDHFEGEAIENKIHILLDAIGHFVNQFLNSKEFSLGKEWQEVKIEKNTLYVRGNC
jgi:hypothetical protein